VTLENDGFDIIIITLIVEFVARRHEYGQIPHGVAAVGTPMRRGDGSKVAQNGRFVTAGPGNAADRGKNDATTMPVAILEWPGYFREEW